MTFDNELFTDEEQEEAIQIAKDFLHPDAELVLLSFTGGRAFGWGGKHHDIDVHGFFAKERHWNKCHSQEGGYDMTVTNIKDINDPDLIWESWKLYYDKSNPIYTHPDWDQEWFIDQCEPENIDHIYPYDLQLQLSRMEKEFHPRSALHSYKEILIPLHYLETGEIESNIALLNDDYYNYPGLSQCVDVYSRRSKPNKVDQQLVESEVYELYDKLGEELKVRGIA